MKRAMIFATVILMANAGHAYEYNQHYSKPPPPPATGQIPPSPTPTTPAQTAPTTPGTPARTETRGNAGGSTINPGAKQGENSQKGGAGTNAGVGAALMAAGAALMANPPTMPMGAMLMAM